MEENLEDLIKNVEAQLGPHWEWLLRKDGAGYFCNIVPIATLVSVRETRKYASPSRDRTMQGALRRSLSQWLELQALIATKKD